MPESVFEIEREVIKKRLANALAEFTAVNAQLGYEASEVDRLRLRRQSDSLEHEIAELQEKLKEAEARSQLAKSSSLTATSLQYSGQRLLRVFLCHATGDKPAVRQLYTRLLRAGVDPWLDEEKLLPGQDWQLEITRAIRNSDVVLVCLSRMSVSKSGYVHKEIAYALDAAEEQPAGVIFLIPVRLEDCQVPERLSSKHWLDLFKANGWDRLSNALKKRGEELDTAPLLAPDATDKQVGNELGRPAAGIELFSQKTTDMLKGAGQPAKSMVVTDPASALNLERRSSGGHALIIGPGADLPVTVADAHGLAQVLTDPERCAYSSSQVRILIDHGATREAIVKELENLSRSVSEDSTFVLYFSGHSYRIEGADGQAKYYLMPHGYDVAHIQDSALEGKELAAHLRAIPTKRMLVLLDCPHASAILDNITPEGKLCSREHHSEASNILVQGAGRIVIAACGEDEYAYTGRPFSVFTLAILEAFGGHGTSKKDGYTRVSDLALYAREMVPGRTNGRQHPELHFEMADDFVVARYPLDLSK